MKTSFLQKDLGGTLVHTMADVPSDGARWDASPVPTVTLKSSSGGTIVASRSATQGPSLAIATSVAASSKTLTMTSTTGANRWSEVVVGPNSSGQWEWATIDGVATSTITVLDELEYAYSTGDAVVSHDLSVTYSTADVGAIYHNAIAEWSYTVDGVARKDHTICHISLYAPRLSLTSAEVVAEDPRAREIIGSNQRLDLMIRRVWERRVLPEIGRLMPPGALVSGEAAENVLLQRVLLEIATKARDTDGVEAQQVRYKLALDEIRTSVIDLDEDGAQGEDERPQSAYVLKIRRA